MSEIKYKFEELRPDGGSYLFQSVKDRPLTAVYHSHDFFEIIYILSGSTSQSVNGEELTMEAMDILILRPDDFHCFLCQSRDVALISLSVARDEFLRISLAFDPALSERITDAPSAPYLRAKGRLLFPSEALSDAELARMPHRLRLLLSSFLELYIDSEPRSGSSPLSRALEKMKLEDNLRRGTEALVEISHYSRSHLARLIKQRHGTTVKRYINDLRLTEAYSMVILSSHSFEDIAFLVGFSSYSHFCKLFKGKFGLTPYCLRRQSRNIL